MGFSLLENKKEFSRGKKRLTRPGKKRKSSLYGLQNMAVQVTCHLYGLKKKQLKNLFIELRNRKGDIREHILTNLESRLGSLVFSSGLISTRRFARQ